MRKDTLPQLVFLHLQIAHLQAQVTELLKLDPSRPLSARLTERDAARSYNLALEYAKTALRGESGPVEVKAHVYELDDIFDDGETKVEEGNVFHCPKCNNRNVKPFKLDKIICHFCGHVCVFTTDTVPENPQWVTFEGKEKT